MSNSLWEYVGYQKNWTQILGFINQNGFEPFGPHLTSGLNRNTGQSPSSSFHSVGPWSVNTSKGCRAIFLPGGVGLGYALGPMTGKMQLRLQHHDSWSNMKEWGCVLGPLNSLFTLGMLILVVSFLTDFHVVFILPVIFATPPRVGQKTWTDRLYECVIPPLVSQMFPCRVPILWVSKKSFFPGWELLSYTWVYVKFISRHHVMPAWSNVRDPAHSTW